MTRNKKKTGNDGGALDHAPSQQGDKTRKRQADVAQAGEKEPPGKRGPSHDPADIREHNDIGKDRLFEDRQQHDEAEKNSEKTRLARDIDRHGHSSEDELATPDSPDRAKRKN